MKSLLLAAFLLVLPVLSRGEPGKAPPPSIGVSPSRIEVAVENGTATGTATVLNMSDRVIHVNTEVVNFDLDEGNNFRELPPDPGSLPMALIVNPVAFTIPPNGSQTVRFAVRPERLSGPGEHRAMLFFSEIVGTSNQALKLRFRLGVPIYASFGPVQSVAQLHGATLDDGMKQLSLDISATGNAQVRPDGYYLFWPLEDYPAETKAISEVSELAAHPNREPPSHTIGGRLSTKPVFPGTRRSVFASIAPPPDRGDYMLVYTVEAGGQRIQRAVRYDPAAAKTANGD